MSTQFTVTTRPATKTAVRKHLLLVAVIVSGLFAGVGWGVYLLVESYGMAMVSETVGAFAQHMQSIRPLVLFVAFCFYQSGVEILARRGALTAVHASRLINNRNRLFIWIGLFELMIGQGQTALGSILLITVLVVRWHQNKVAQPP